MRDEAQSSGHRDGIRLEINFIPGKGLLVTPDKLLAPSTDRNDRSGSASVLPAPIVTRIP
jgi:hypothetical protein